MATDRAGIRDEILVGTASEAGEIAEGVKGPDPEQWGDAARRERGAHPDDNPQPEEPNE